MVEQFLLLWGADTLRNFGIMSGALSALCFFPYIRDTLRGDTRPARASWLIWAVLGSIAFISQISEGLDTSFWFVCVQVGGTIMIFILSIWRGDGAYLTSKNLIVLLLAGTGLIAWYLTDHPIYALLLSVFISLLAGSVTIYKSFIQPETETLSTWMIGLIASLFGLLSVGELNWMLLVYPLYLLTLYSGIIAAIMLGRIYNSKLSEERGFADVTATGAVFVRSGGYRPPSHPYLAPEGQVFDQVEELAAEKYVQVPMKHEPI